MLQRPITPCIRSAGCCHQISHAQARCRKVRSGLPFCRRPPAGGAGRSWARRAACAGTAAWTMCGWAGRPACSAWRRAHWAPAATSRMRTLCARSGNKIPTGSSPGLRSTCLQRCGEGDYADALTAMTGSMRLSGLARRRRPHHCAGSRKEAWMRLPFSMQRAWLALLARQGAGRQCT